MFAFNTAGNVAGALAAGLWLLPTLGLKPLFGLGMLLDAAVGAAVLFALGGGSARRKAAFVAAAGAPALAAAVLGAWDPSAMTSAPYRLRGPMAAAVSSMDEFRRFVDDSDLLFYREDADASVAVTRRRDDGSLSLKINGKADASTGLDMRSQSLMGHLPLLLKPNAREVFMVGLGFGITAGAILKHPVTRLDAAELLPAVADAARVFDGANGRALDDPRTNLTLDDAKTVLRASPRRYDAIVSEPTNPWIAGVGGLFTEEFYRTAAAHLNEGGVVGQWFHLYAMNDRLLMSVLTTFCAEFPYATIWEPMPGDIVLIGSKKPLSVDLVALERRFSEPGVRADLARIGVGRLPTLLSLQTASEEQTRRVLASSLQRAQVNRDRRPVLEYGAPKAFFLSEEATALAVEDQRLQGDTGRELLFSRWLATRAGGPDGDDYADLTRYHGWRSSPLAAAIEADWARRRPTDPRAAQARKRLDAARARRADEDRATEAAVRAEPRDGLPLLKTADAALARHFARRSFLDPGEPAAAEAAMRRLERSGLVSPIAIDQRWAALETIPDPRAALARLKAIGAVVERNRSVRGAAVWVDAARLAARVGDDAEAADCARRALALDPANDAARVLSERFSAPK